MAKGKGGNPRSIPEGKKQVNFNIDEALLVKVKGIAYVEGVTNSDVYNRSVETYVELYEKKNGRIKSKPQGKGLF